MDDREIKLLEAIRAYNANADKLHQNLVDAVNQYIAEGGDKYSVYPETEREIDAPAQFTAWIYGRLGNSKRDNRIKKALGYN